MGSTKLNNYKLLGIKMKLSPSLYICLFSIFSLNSVAVAEENIWQDEVTIEANFKVMGDVETSSQKESHQFARKLSLNESKMKSLLADSQQISLPLPNGTMIDVTIELDNILPTELLEKYPSIRTYRVLPTNELISGRVDMTENGFHGMLQMRNGETVFIDPSEASSQNARFKSVSTNSSNQYVSYKQHEQTHTHGEGYSCGASHKLESMRPDIENSPLFKRLSKTSAKFDTQGQLTVYRIAVAATGEYVKASGGTIASALSQIATTMSRVNEIYEKDLGVRLSLVENNDQLIYTDAASDPYNSKSPDELIEENQNNIDSVIGSNNYDIGHLFTTTGGGIAAIGSVCNNSRKAMGVSGIANPFNDSFNVDYVAHEMGHQFGATHTFNSELGLCAGGTRTSITAFEPGSGTSVMSYAGHCGNDDIQSKSDAMFHIGSVEQVRVFTQSGGGSLCGTQQVHNNKAPIVDAGIDYVIPARTPFEITGSAYDADGDSLVYGWEQIDAGTRSLENEDTGDNALFRTYMPTYKESRVFPALDSILTGNKILGETLPTQERELNFSLVAQDGFNASRSDQMTVSVKRTGSRFAIEQPRAHYVLGRSHTLKWNTADTQNAPVSCGSVDVYLSTSGGYEFPHKLLENVPNTGEASIFLETSLPTVYQGRFKIKCSNNIFFAVSQKNFRLILDDVADAEEVGPEENLLDEPLDKKEKTTEASGGSSDLFFMMMLALGFIARKKL